MKQTQDRASAAVRISRRGFLAAAGAAAGGLQLRWSSAATTGPAGITAYPAKAVTSGPKHHFFGYYDKCPWDRSGRYLLAMEIGFIDRQPKPREPLTVGMVDLRDGNRYIPLDQTTAWCWQQGTMLQWLGPAGDREVIYNIHDDGGYVAVIRDVHSGRTRVLPAPIYAVSADGRQAVSLDFDRVNRLRPGYGYVMLPDRNEHVAAPPTGGIYRMDLASGKNRLIIPVSWAAGHRPDERFKDAHHWFNHLQFNPSGTRFIFLHRWKAEGKGRYTRLYTARPDGTDIRLHCDTGMVSHFDWRDDDTILAWATLKPKTNRFCLFDVNGGQTRVLGEGVLTQDGHCSYSPDRKWLLVDTYPDRDGNQHLFLYRLADGRKIEIGAFALPKELRGKPYRCDLHPRWNRDGTQVCIDSAHRPARQVYVIDVRSLTR